MRIPLLARFTELVREGTELYDEALRSGEGGAYVGDVVEPRARAWMLSVVNVLEHAVPAASRYVTQARQLIPATEEVVTIMPLRVLCGILRSAFAEWENGMLEPLEHRFAAPTLAGFLKAASQLLADTPPQLPAAAVLASAVFEDAIRRLCMEHNLGGDGASIEARLDLLKANGVIRKNANKRLKGFTGVRDAAFHANWAELSESHVRQLIEVVDDLIDEHFGDTPPVAGSASNAG